MTKKVTEVFFEVVAKLGQKAKGKSGSKAGSGADDIIQYEKLKSQYAADEIYNANRVGSALKEDPAHRASSYLVNNKWMFAIIYDAYINDKCSIFDVTEDVYAEFEYPDIISNLVRYMPCEDHRPMEEKLLKYLNENMNMFRG